MKVSVIVPVYNAASFIERCVKSLLGQTYTDLEIIFIDDKSTDNSLEVLYRVLEENNATSRVTVIESSENCGCAVTRLKGMKATTGEYMIHVDSDDYVAPQFIESLVSVAESNDSDVVVCEIAYDYGNKMVSRHIVPVDSTRKALANVLNGVMHGSLCNKLIRSSIIIEHDIYPTQGITLGEDKFILVRVLYYASRVDFVPEALYYYNKTNESSFTSQTKANAIPRFVELTRQINAFFDGKQTDVTIDKALKHHKALVLGHLLLYGCKADVENNADLFAGLTCADVTSHPVAPFYYKMVGVAHLCRLHFIVTVLQAVMKLAARR